METLRDLLDEIRLGLTERITSPLLGTYIVSWLICNYRVLMAVFGDGTTAQKFSMLTVQMYGGSWHWHFLYTFFWPAVLTAFYIWVYPKLAKPVYEMRLTNLREMTQIRQKIENEQLLSVEASRKLRQEMLELKEELNKQQKDFEQTIDALQKQLAEERKKQGKEEQQQAISKNSEPLRIEDKPRTSDKREREDLLNLMTLGYIGLNFNESFALSKAVIGWQTATLHGLSPIAARAVLDRLNKSGLIEYMSGEEELRLSIAGRQFVAEQNLDNPEVLKNLINRYLNPNVQD